MMPSVNIDTDVYERVKARAAAEERTVSKEATRLLRDRLGQLDEPKASEPNAAF